MMNKDLIDKMARDCIRKYETVHGNKGVAKKDVIEAVMKAGGDMTDVRRIMIKAATQIFACSHGIRTLYE